MCFLSRSPNPNVWLFTLMRRTDRFAADKPRRVSVFSELTFAIEFTADGRRIVLYPHDDCTLPTTIERDVRNREANTHGVKTDVLCEWICHRIMLFEYQMSFAMLILLNNNKNKSKPNVCASEVVDGTTKMYALRSLFCNLDCSRCLTPFCISISFCRRIEIEAN